MNKRWLVIPFIVLFGLEAALQLAAFVTWVAYRRPIARQRPTGRVVLCVGDSFTYGGANDAWSRPRTVAPSLEDAPA